MVFRTSDLGVTRSAFVKEESKDYIKYPNRRCGMETAEKKDVAPVASVKSCLWRRLRLCMVPYTVGQSNVGLLRVS
jgi:hypothetical protein